MPQLSTRFGIPRLPSIRAIAQDSEMSSALPSPEASNTNRVRSLSRCSPDNRGMKWIGDETQKSSPK